VQCARVTLTHNARVRAHTPSAARVAAVAGTLGEYEVQRLIGVGGFGEVYEARHRLDGRVAALKKVRIFYVCRVGVCVSDAHLHVCLDRRLLEHTE
jgi:hypothetical protein